MIIVIIMIIRNYLCAPMSVYFNAYRDNAYNRGGEEILKVIIMIKMMLMVVMVMMIIIIIMLTVPVMAKITGTIPKTASWKDYYGYSNS